jgi:hypothetical protein
MIFSRVIWITFGIFSAAKMILIIECEEGAYGNANQLDNKFIIEFGRNKFWFKIWNMVLKRMVVWGFGGFMFKIFDFVF